MLTNEDTETALQSSGGATLSLKEKKKAGFSSGFRKWVKIGKNKKRSDGDSQREAHVLVL